MLQPHEFKPLSEPGGRWSKTQPRSLSDQLKFRVAAQTRWGSEVVLLGNCV